MSKPTPFEQRKRFAAFARQLESGLPVTTEQNDWLRNTFLALADPNRDVLRVLGLNYSAGRSAQKEEAAAKMDVVIHWITCAISDDNSHLADPEGAVPPLSLDQALEQASIIAKRLFRVDPDSEKYGVEYIRKCWYETEEIRRKALDRDPFDPDSYYRFPV